MMFARPFVWLLLLVAGALSLAAQTKRPTSLDLITAARRGDGDLLRRALDAGVPVDATDPYFRQTALIRAAMFAQTEAVKMLLAARADVERVASPGDSLPLHFAAIANHADGIRLMLGAGALVDSRDGFRETPLDHAISKGSVEAVHALLAGGADPNRLGKSIAARIGMALNPDVPANEIDALLVVIRTGRGLEREGDVTGDRTALLAFALRANRPGAERFAEALVEGGANLAATDEKGRTALEIVEGWLPSQRDAGYRKTMEAVVGILRKAEARR